MPPLHVHPRSRPAGISRPHLKVADLYGPFGL
jgi:hypothetical protein